MRPLFLVTLTGALSGLLSCGGGLGPNEGLVSTVTLDRTVLIPGEPLRITVAVTGPGILQGSSTCLIGFSILNAENEIVAPGDVVCTGDLVTESVPLVQHFVWRGYTGLETNGMPLPAGRYRVIGGPGRPGATRVSASNPVSVELAEATPEAARDE
jgi:hypothetical protein